jgi:hypothetical protein
MKVSLEAMFNLPTISVDRMSGKNISADEKFGERME